MAVLIVLVLGVLFAAPAMAQPPESACGVVPRDITRVARDWWFSHHTSWDAAPVIVAMDSAVFGETAYLNDHSTIALSSRSSDGATLTFPYLAFRRAVADVLGKHQPIEHARVPDGVVIAIEPTALDSHHIIDVVVTRDGVAVPPIRNGLAVRTLPGSDGRPIVRHAGTVVFPCSAFAPGASVRVTLVAAPGPNIERALRPMELTPLAGRQDRAMMLVGLQATEVETLIGKPLRVDGLRWNYEAFGQTLFVYFDSAGEVVSASPAHFDYSSLRK